MANKINKIKVENTEYDIEDKNALTEETDPVFSASPSAEITNQDISNWNNKSEFSGDYDDLSNKPDLSQFITNTVNNLTNYYLKSETYTKDEITALISAIQQFHYEIVQELPQTGANNIMYLVPKSDEQTSNYYDEYVYANNNWEKIGDTEIDLSGYVTTDTLNTVLANYMTEQEIIQMINDNKSATIVTSEMLEELQTKYKSEWLNTDKFTLPMLYLEYGNGMYVFRTNATYYKSLSSGYDIIKKDTILFIFQNGSQGIFLNGDYDYIVITYMSTVGFKPTIETRYNSESINYGLAQRLYQMLNLNITSTDILNWNNKQNTLTAGDGISINNDVISASDYYFEYKSGNDTSAETLAFWQEIYDKILLSKNINIYTYRKVDTADTSILKWVGLKSYKSTNYPTFVFATLYQDSTNVNYDATSRLYVQLTITSNVVSNVYMTIANYGIAHAYGIGRTGALSSDNGFAFTPIAGSYNPATAKYAEEKAEAVRVQYNTMPTASADNLGKIVQYTGVDTQDYTQGHFYVVVSDGESTPTYSWQEISFGGSSSVGITYKAGRDTSAESIALYQEMFDKYKNNENLNNYYIKSMYSYGPFQFSQAYHAPTMHTIYFVFTGFGNLENTTVRYTSEYNVTVLCYLDTNNENITSIYSYFNTWSFPTMYSNYNRYGALVAGNSEPYTPTSDYNPATKKYVDDQVGAINTVLATLTTPTQGGN